ncbi:acyl-CoA N-acyltransferase [Amylostereum chailletii]|nr:acyl-CoA N-acyltransferase [Amylostereum chailletii]
MAASVKLIENPTDAQVEETVQLLCQAFEGDATIPGMTGDNPELIPAFFRSMLRAGALEGSYYVVDDDAGKILTIGLWFGPGQEMFSRQGWPSVEAQRAAGWNDFFAALSPEAQHWWNAVFHKKHGDMIQTHLGPDYTDSWFANIVATHPAHQRNGYASMLIKTVCARAEKENKRATLATQSEDNTRFYQGLGFKLLGMTDIPVPDGSWNDYVLRWETSL